MEYDLHFKCSWRPLGNFQFKYMNLLKYILLFSYFKDTEAEMFKILVNQNSTLNETFIGNLGNLTSLKNSTSKGYIIKLESSFFKNSKVKLYLFFEIF